MALQRLEAALADQAQLADAHRRAAGTPGEMASKLRLQASNLQVAVCERLVGGIRRTQRRTGAT